MSETQNQAQTEERRTTYIQERVKIMLGSIRNSIPEWAERGVVVFAVGYATLTACIDPRCFKPVATWRPLKRNKSNNGYYYGALWKPYRVLLEEDELEYLVQRGVKPGWPYLLALGDKVEIYAVKEKHNIKYTVVTPQEKILEL